MVSGTFRTAAKRFPPCPAMGFDVLYLPPIHPIGSSYRKGPTTLTREGGRTHGHRGRSGRPRAGTMPFTPSSGHQGR